MERRVRAVPGAALPAAPAAAREVVGVAAAGRPFQRVPFLAFPTASRI